MAVVAEACTGAVPKARTEKTIAWADEGGNNLKAGKAGLVRAERN